MTTAIGPIVVGVDGSLEALKAARMAAELAVAEGAKVVLVCAVGPAPLPAVPDWVTAPPNLYQELRDEAGGELRRVADVIKQPDAEQIVLEGGPAQVLVQAASDRAASMLVVGSRGHGAVARLLLGSVADRVVHLAHCPVLVVR